jgi:hypothetical protein
MLRYSPLPFFSTPNGWRSVRPIAVALITLLGFPLVGQNLTVESPLRDLITDYCISCHNPEKKKGKLDLESILLASMDQHFETWDEVAWMLREREMPPEDKPEEPRPSEEEYEAVVQWLKQSLESITPSGQPPVITSKLALVDKYCVSCHNAEENKGDINLDAIRSDDILLHPETWEKVITRLQSRRMPPMDRKRPSEETYGAIVSSLSDTLDRAAMEKPIPGRVETFRRLNRTEYQNAIRDLVGVEVDAASLLPKDEESHGFDNVTVSTLSPVLLERYVSAAQKISRLAVGTYNLEPQVNIFRIPPEVTQEKHIDGLPIGTRGGTLLTHNFPQDGEYEIEVTLARGHDEEVEGLRHSHELEILLDNAVVESFTVQPPEEGQDHSLVDKHIKVRLPLRAGPQKLGVTFISDPYWLLENKRQPFKVHFNSSRHPRLSPALYQISITGPFNAKGATNTPSREKIFIRQPQNSKEEEPVAREILARLMKLAYRRSISKADFTKPISHYRKAARKGGFEAGIEAALSSILVHPEFLFRIERGPIRAKPDEVYRISELELASRLSFFIWSSLPDEALLDLAIAGQLSQPDVLEKQVRRMLTDSRSQSLVDNFANQWLHLRNLESVTPDMREYPDFDDNLRQALRKETELLFESILREDRSVLNLIKADYTFLNERLAYHYDIPNVFGSRFRRVDLDPKYKRGGLLRQGSILTVTSYANRTSPVIRGNWILENILGTPAPPPPANVPALKENKVDSTLSVRERLAEHRANPACASCHDIMDPIGFALENFDAIGRWRDFEYGASIDSSGGLPDGSIFEGVENLENGLLKRPELFVRTLSEKLLIFSLGRGIEWYDAPAIRQIVKEAEANEYRFSSIILGIVNSVPFQMRNKSKGQYASNQPIEKRTP